MRIGWPRMIKIRLRLRLRIRLEGSRQEAGRGAAAGPPVYM